MHATKWFKVLKDDRMIGLVTDEEFARYSESSGRVHICRAIEGQYCVLDGVYYRDEWMLTPPPESYITYENAEVKLISRKEYDRLKATSDEAPIEVGETDISPEAALHRPVSREDLATADYIRGRKIQQLSEVCAKSIEGGFSLVLSDGASHHFSLTLQDQLNLVDLQRALDGGEDLVYHADGELAQFYSREDATDILSCAAKWKQYNQVLFNSLKNWVNALSTWEEIDAVQFDSEIPEQYCTPVLQVLTESF